jgi:hypothetical protein
MIGAIARASNRLLIVAGAGEVGEEAMSSEARSAAA